MANNTPPGDKGPPDKNPIDIRLVKQLVGLMRDNDLSEISMALGRARVRIRRGGFAPVQSFAPAGAMTHASQPSTSSGPASDNGAAAPAAEAGTFIKSPTVGTFYVASSPESPPFVKVGSTVQPDTVVCMVEAMKVFNEIPAGLAGTILEILVENAAPVEFGQPLFRVKSA